MKQKNFKIGDLIELIHFGFDDNDKFIVLKTRKHLTGHHGKTVKLFSLRRKRINKNLYSINYIKSYAKKVLLP